MQRTTFLTCKELYETIQQKSLRTKGILWVCSPSVGVDAHKIFAQDILKNPPADMRFVFRVNDVAVKRGEVNPYEIQYFMEQFRGSNVRTNESFHTSLYIFDDSALITSANLTKASFESNTEAGVLIDASQVEDVKSFFTLKLWENAKPVTDVKKFKKLWNETQKNGHSGDLSRNKPYTKIKDWADDSASIWYFAVPDQLTAKTEQKIKKETNWATDLSVAGDIGPIAFKQLKLGDLAFIVNLNKKQGKIEVKYAKVFDKSRVETDEGDLHFAYETKKAYSIDRNLFQQMLGNANIKPKSYEVLLNEDQSNLITKTLSSNKPENTPKVKTAVAANKSKLKKKTKAKKRFKKTRKPKK